MIIETIDIHGHERIINANFITNIEYSVVTANGARRNPKTCSGVKGDPLIKVYMSTGQVITIACDHNGDDVTHDVLQRYKNIMHVAARA